MDSRRARELINKTIFENHIVEADLAAYLGITPQSLNYTLHNAKYFDITIYNRIKQYFYKKGIQLYESTEVLMKAQNYSIELTSILAHQISFLNNLIEDLSKREKITAQSKAEIIKQIENMEKEVSAKIEEIKGTVQKWNEG